MGQRTFILVKKNYIDINGEWASRVSHIHHQWGLGRVMQGLLLQEVLKTQYNLNRNLGYLYLDKSEVLPNDNGFLKQPISRFYTFRPLSNPSNNYSVLGNNFKELGLKEIKGNTRKYAYYEEDGITLKEEGISTDVIIDYPCDYNYDIFDIEHIQSYAKISDNNNGCMIVDVTQRYDKGTNNPERIISEAFDVKVGFCTGWEETNFYSPVILNIDDIEYNPAFSTLVSPVFYAVTTYNHKKECSQFAKSFMTICKQSGVKFVYDTKREKELTQLQEHLTKICEALKERGCTPEEIEKEVKRIVNGQTSCFA